MCCDMRQHTGPYEGRPPDDDGVAFATPRVMDTPIAVTEFFRGGVHAAVRLA